MKKKPLTEFEIAAKLTTHVDAGRRIQGLLDDPVVAAFFRQMRQDLADEMLAAKIDDDAARRNAAIKISLLDDLRIQLENAVTNGQRATKALEKIKKEKQDA